MMTRDGLELVGRSAAAGVCSWARAAGDNEPATTAAAEDVTNCRRVIPNFRSESMFQLLSYFALRGGCVISFT